MDKLFHKLDDVCNGWLSTTIVILLEVFIVYVLSNIPFILTTLETPISSENDIGFLGSFLNVLENEIQKGQLLTFVCALIAPVVFWSFVEFRKAVVTKILSVAALLLLAAAAYLHAKGSEFEYFTDFNLYQAALLVWIFSILGNRIPPDRDAFFKHTRQQEQNILNMIP